MDVILIGLGNIGFRHLQGLGRSRNPLRVYVHDLVAANLQRAVAEAANLQHAEIIPVTALDQLPQAADIAILATSAQGRFELLQALLSRRRLRHVILEKVVFQAQSAFAAATALLEPRETHGQATQAWVNCPRRLWPLYRSMKSALRPGAPFRLTVRGRNFGLACNTVHMIDALQFLTGCADVSLEDSAISRIFPAKRPGHCECYGRLGFSTAAGSRLDVICEEDGPTTPEWQWSYGDGAVDLSEATGCFADPEADVDITAGRPPFQSELTGLVIDELARSSGCALADLTESAMAHAVLFEALGPAFGAAGLDTDLGLPIT